MINYSIIIPHYNTPSLLKRCLESIPERDDIQTIVVDDCSTSENIYILRNIEKNYPNALFIYSENNGGAGAARNKGLHYAKGQWVLFADADDYFKSSFLNCLDSKQNSDADIVFFNAQSEDSNDTRANHLKFIHSLLDKEKIQTYLRFAFGEPWCKMIRLKLVQENNISFEDSFIHNDTRFSYLVGFFAQKIEWSSETIYIVTRQPKSVSQQSSLKVLEYRTKIFAEKNNFLRLKHIKYFDWLMISPLWDGLKKKDFEFIKKYFFICKSFNFSSFSIIKKFLIFIIKAIDFKLTQKQIF